MSALIPLPVVLSLFGAGLCLIFGRSARAQRVISLVVLSGIVAIAAVLLVGADTGGPRVTHLGGWPVTLGISLVADRLSALMLLISAIVTLCVLVYSLGQGVVEYGRDTPLSVFHPTYLVLSAGVSNAFLSGDLFNIYVGFEVLLAASYVLITLGGTEPRIRAGSTYVVISLLSSVLFLIALAAVYAAAGTVNLAQLAIRLQDIPPDVRLILQLLLLTAFAVKAAVFPLAAWLPDSYPTAPAPVTAVFAGLLTKVGVYAIIRTQTLLFPESPLTDLLLWAALLTMVIGILGAIAQSDLKRMLSFTLVSHIGYMIFGIGLATDVGLSGAIFYVVHHITIQTTLFLVAGLIELRGGTSDLDRLGGMVRTAPLLALLFFVPAMNLAGIPPLSGFLGKLALVQGGIDRSGFLAYVLVAGAILTSLLTLYAIAKAWNLAFWAGPQSTEGSGPRAGAAAEPDFEAGIEADIEAGTEVGVEAEALGVRTATRPSARLPRGMALPTVALVLVGVAMSVFAGPLFALTDRAAADLHARTPYIDAVLDGAPGGSSG